MCDKENKLIRESEFKTVKDAFPKLDVRYRLNLTAQFPNDESKMVFLEDDENVEQIKLSDI